MGADAKGIRWVATFRYVALNLQSAEGMAEPTPRLVLNHLIETCRDSERGYRAAAGLVEGPTLKAKLLEMADERARFAQELIPHAQRLGGDDAADGTRAAAIHRRWMDFKAKLSPHNDQAIFAEVLRGDEVTLRTYETALEEVLPASVRDLVEAQAKKVRDVHERLEELEPPPHSPAWK
jgi:uncharacterized protein (TIGR02284 family)